MNLPLLAAIDAADPRSDTAESLAAIAGTIADRLAHGKSIARQLLTRLMAERFGGSDASGAGRCATPMMPAARQAPPQSQPFVG